MSMGKRRRVGGDEQDALSRHSRALYKWRRGAVGLIKRGARRRERRQARQNLQRGDGND